jgi:hypothetical protein
LTPVHRLVLVLCAALLPAPAAAGAATVSRSKDAIVYAADPGEVNQVTVTHEFADKDGAANDVDTVTVTDPTATLTATAPCAATDAHTVLCTSKDLVFDFRAQLSDGTDSFTNESDLFSHVLGDTGGDTLSGGNTLDELDGGPGDDVLDGAGDKDTLDGGGGIDMISGGDGPDLLRDGDGAIADSDTIDGGAGRDIVDYTKDNGPIVLDLSGAATNASDTITGTEDAVGSAGDDTITGSDAANALAGGRGADTIDGGGGNDKLAADKLFRHFNDGTPTGATDTVADTIAGGAGDDQLDLGGGQGTATCGDGADVLGAFDPSTVVPADCETLIHYTDPKFHSPRDAATFEAQPRDHSARTLTFGLACPRSSVFDAGEPQRCSGVIQLRSTGGKLLGRAKFHGDAAKRKAIVTTVPLNAAGRRLLADGGVIVATLRGLGITWRFELP